LAVGVGGEDVVVLGVGSCVELDGGVGEWDAVECGSNGVVVVGWVEGEDGFPQCGVESAGFKPERGSELLYGFVSFWSPVAVVASWAAGGGEEALKDFDVFGVAVGGGNRG